MAGDVTLLHRWHHDNYDVAKKHIHQQLGDISDMRLTGRQVMVAVYVRPGGLSAGGLLQGTLKEQKNDWWEGKASLIIATGPSAFDGTDAYLKATFHQSIKPKVGDWVITNANAGIQMNISGEGSERVKSPDRRGDLMDTYEWDGWPCRVVLDDSIIMLVDAPHTVI